MKQLYDVLPVFFQNLAISVYGFKLRRERYGSEYRKIFKEIDLFLSPSDTALGSRISRFLMEVIDSVPAYGDVLSDSSERNAGKLSDTVSILNRFPITDKNQLRESPKSYVSNNRKGKVVLNHTSGSTGTPLEIVATSFSLQFNYAFFHRFLSEVGVSEFERSATFAGRMIVPKGQHSSVFWRKNYAMNTLLLSSYHISKKSAKEYLAALESWMPAYIDSYPSAIYELASFFKELDINPRINLKAIVTSSETLFKYQRQVIEEVFDCPVFDHYGCAEQAVVAFQLQSEKDAPYLVPAQYCLVEVLDDLGHPVSPGQEGRLICTNLFNSAMPLIRYDIGDRAVLKEYYTGTSYAQSLSSISGRADDVITTSEGVKVGRLDPVLKGLKGIKEAQIVQHSFELIEIRLVLFDVVTINEERLISLLKERVGDEFDVKISYMESLPRDKSGKFRSVISNI